MTPLVALPLFGSLAQVPLALSIIVGVVVLLTLGYLGASFWLWLVGAAAAFWGVGADATSWIVLGIIAVLFGVPPVRRAIISRGIMGLMQSMNFLPTISETEQTAIEAGEVWLEGELFSGQPNFDTFHETVYPDLDPEEQEFLDGPVEEVCGMVDNWNVHVEKRLPDDVWEYLKEERFFSLIIPEEYGGRDFSALGSGAVVSKLASRCSPLAITVMVPNSLGPAELLINYGTKEQQDHYLPRLAKGEEIPAFALTEPEAGSDAGAMTSHGEVFEGDDGELYIRLNWEKRYITLSPISTILGLAFKLRDPNHLLGGEEDLGITCALIPTDKEGVSIDSRHDPLGVPFLNAPTRGNDVVVPIDAIIGGAEQAGNGWRMLMESLAAGRGIMLPATATGTAKKTTRVVSAYARIRKQFGLPIGKFEGIEEPMARIGGMTYLIDAARTFTCAGLDEDHESAVVAAIMKYHTSEMGRQIINDGMDILGGAGIVRGPRNLLALDYQGVPISITVEGANILTRSLMIFGQGAIRCHPYIYQEITALIENDVKAFDRALWKHIGHIVQNMTRAGVIDITRGYLTRSPVSGPASRYYQKLAWTSASFAFLSDIALITLGGALKRKEKLSGRFADVLSLMYLASATLQRFEAEDRQHEPYFHWAMQYLFGEIQDALDGVLKHLPIPGLGWLFHGPIYLWSRLNPIGTGPSDALGHQVASMMQEPGGVRDALTEDIFVPDAEGDAFTHLENTFRAVHETAPIRSKIRDAVKAGELPKARPEKLIGEALEADVISETEADELREAERLRTEAIQVDEFGLDEYAAQTPSPPPVTSG